MSNNLVRLSPHIDHVRTTLSQTAEAERSLVQSLSDELKRMDQDTLRSVRNMSAEHEARRAGILDELQALASSIGTFRSQHEAVLPQRVAAPEPVAPPTPIDWPAQRAVASESVAAPTQIDFTPNGSAPARGDWRQAITNLDIKDDLAELELYMTGRDPRH